MIGPIVKPHAVLSARLKKLVASGVTEQVPASDGSSYQEYALTQKGRELLPVLVALRQREKVISSPAARNVFRFWTNAPAPPDWKCETGKGKSLRRTI
jgi:HxlR-like helix-turn-helix protein